MSLPDKEEKKFYRQQKDIGWVKAVYTKQQKIRFRNRFYTHTETEELKDEFPHQVLTNIVGRPTQEKLRLLRVEMTAKSASIPSSRGGGDYRHMIFLMTPAKFATFSNAVFDVPTNTGNNPKIPRGSEAIEIIELQRGHAVEEAEYKLFHKVDKVLKQKLLTAADEIFVKSLKMSLLLT